MPAQCSGGPLTRAHLTNKELIVNRGDILETGEKTEDTMSRSRSTSESSDNLDHLGLGGMCEVGEVKRGVSYDMDGKFTYSQVSME